MFVMAARSLLCIFLMSASVVSALIASSVKDDAGTAWAEKPISAASNFAASSEAIRTLCSGMPSTSTLDHQGCIRHEATPQKPNFKLLCFAATAIDASQI
jgi:hypothetical protein